MNGSVKQVPVFGTREAGHSYVLRPSAYALLQNADGNLAVVRTPRGCFLPGGGAEKDETPQQTVEREIKEECGFLVQAWATMLRAIQFIYSEEEHEYFEKICEFLPAKIIGSAPRTELDHEVVWMSPDQAQRLLHHESHRWAVQCLFSSQPNAAERPGISR